MLSRSAPSTHRTKSYDSAQPLIKEKPMRSVICEPHALGHSAECPQCKALTLVTGPPQIVKCACGAEWFATWHRFGDPVAKVEAS
jgi:hypothetical protein